MKSKLIAVVNRFMDNIFHSNFLCWFGFTFRSSGEKLPQWEDIHRYTQGKGVDNILKIMDLIHSLPPISVGNETAFNQMKLIKTDRRQRLTEEHLNDMMLIRLQSPTISQFDPTPAVDRWMVIIMKIKLFNWSGL